MFIETIRTPGLAHLSYVIGDDGNAAVIDPRRDCDIYLDIAGRNDSTITHVFETHRNEDLISGAPLVAARTGARVIHGPHADGEVRYADEAADGKIFNLGNTELRVLHTPGHTEDSISIAAYDRSTGTDAVAVFTGDALFVGDVGRTDFYPDRPEEVAGELYDSLGQIAGLGDQALVLPAHGAGSVCGSNMASREFSSIGYERANNPMLNLGDREDFIHRKVNEHHYIPPYFGEMEQLNLTGAPAMPDPDELPLCTVDTLASIDRDNHVIVDVRDCGSFCGAHIPGALCLPSALIPAYAGWLLPTDVEISLVADDLAAAKAAAVQLARIGYDEVRRLYTDGMHPWAVSARTFATVAQVDVTDIADRLAESVPRWILLDVREAPEYDAGHIEGATHIFLGELPDRLARLDPAQPITVMCASGVRSTVGASILQRNGFGSVDVFLGSMGAWNRADHRA